MKPRLQRRLLLLLLLCTVSASFLLFPISLKPSPRFPLAPPLPVEVADDALPPSVQRSCATVEEMGAGFAGNIPEVNLRVRDLVETHFQIHGAARVRELPPHQFCRQGFVLGKASEAGFGNEMYKILTAAALSIMLNRSLIIGKSRGKYPFEDYILYSNTTLTMEEVKHLWRKNKCIEKYKKDLVIRVDDFEKPTETNVICGNWRAWSQPIIWFQGTTDAVASQFFLKNMHIEMRSAALSLFGPPESLQARANVFGELLRMIISPSHAIKEAVNWALNGGVDPDLALHMRMMSNRSLRAKQAALNCIKRALSKRPYQNTTAKIVLVSDTPSFVKDIIPDLTKFANVVQFNYKSFMELAQGENISRHEKLDLRAKDWGPAPRWVAFADFFLAARAKQAVISGAHRRVGTTYAQLIAALAAANQLEEDSSVTWKFSFYSSFQSNLLAGGLANQVGWGHVWNRYAGPFSCRGQKHQCAYTPLLPPAWWDGDRQSPISRDVRRLQEYGVQLSDTGKVIESSIQSFCKSKKQTVRTIPVIRRCNSRNCT